MRRVHYTASDGCTRVWEGKWACSVCGGAREESVLFETAGETFLLMAAWYNPCGHRETTGVLQAPVGYGVLTCDACGERVTHAEPNRPGGGFRCYRCRQTWQRGDGV